MLTALRQGVRSSRLSQRHQATPLSPSPSHPPSRHVATARKVYSPSPLDDVAEEDRDPALSPSWEELSDARADPPPFDWEDTLGREVDERDLGGYAADEGTPALLDWAEARLALEPETTSTRPTATCPPLPTPTKTPSRRKTASVASPAASSRPQPSAAALLLADEDRDEPLSRPVDPSATRPDSPITPFLPSPRSSPFRQPHEFPLISRYDWRLSTPRLPPRPSPTEPPPLSKDRPGAQQRMGFNRLIGVGLSPPAEAGRWKGIKDEPWGWNLRVPENQRGAWKSGDAYKTKCERFLKLCRIADERQHVIGLAMVGPPEVREARGQTIVAAVGRWMMDAPPKGKEAGTGDDAPRREPKIIGIWSRADGAVIDEESYTSFVPGTSLRFTPTQPEKSSRPQKPIQDAKACQGQLLEYKNGELVVAFNESDYWPLEDEEYRIDLGLDESGYTLQELAIESLFFDPDPQRKRNLEHVRGAQLAFFRGSESQPAPSLREWVLQGTDLRELIVPDTDSTAPPSRSAPSSSDEDADDSSPASEIAHLPPSNLPPDGVTRAVHPSTLYRDNQLINSWILRHNREVPISMHGDPDLGLNESQTKAVAMALGERLSLIQGPPGTGKSQTIVAIINLLKLHFRIPTPILLAAPTHVSTDHLLTHVVQAGLNPLRLGYSSRVGEEGKKWTVEKRREQHPMWTSVEEARKEAEKKRLQVREEKEKAVVKGGKGKMLVSEKLQKLEQEYTATWRRFVWLEHRMYASLLATADVFLATTMGSGPSKASSIVDFPIVFIDEAAMCTEPVTLIPLMKGCQQATLIGDHNQLPAVVLSPRAKQERLHESLFERLIRQKSVKSILLDTQYRMRPAISAFPNETFYQSALKDSESVQTRPDPPLSAFLDPGQSTVFLSHTSREETYRRSTVNRAEIDLIVSIVGDLLSRNPSLSASDIGIISPYSGQTHLLRSEFQFEPQYSRDSRPAAEVRLHALLGDARAAQVSQVEINTIDGFQGREKKVVILSTVRSNNDGQIGFLTDRRRLNVALTRARDALFVVGNAKTLEAGTMRDWPAADRDAEVGIWRKYVGWMRKQDGGVREWRKEDFVG